MKDNTVEILPPGSVDVGTETVVSFAVRGKPSLAVRERSPKHVVPPREHAREIVKELSAVAVKLSPAVARIRSGFGRRTSTGFLVGPNLIATTARTVRHPSQLQLEFEDTPEIKVKSVRIHPRWSKDSGPYWDAALIEIEPTGERPVVIPAAGPDVLDPVVVLGHLDADVGLCAQVGTIDGIVMERGAEIIFVSGLGERICYGAPVFNRLGMVVGMTSGDLRDPRNAGDFGRGSGVAAVVPIDAVTSLVMPR